MRRTFLTFITLSLSLVGTAALAEESTPVMNSGADTSTSSDIQYSDDEMAGQAADDTSQFSDDDYVDQEAGTIDESDDVMIYDDSEAAGTAETTTADAGEYDSALKNEAVGLKPQIGVMSFDNVVTGESEVRGAAGATLDFNMTGLVRDEPSPLFVGLSTGALYSRVGAPGADFFGSGGVGDAASLILIPANAKIGWNVSDGFRLGVHGGGNVIYRSNASTVALGTTTGTGSDWSVFPNAGADFEFGIGRNTALILRPDVTFTSGDELLSGTLGFSIALG